MSAWRTLWYRLTHPPVPVYLMPEQWAQVDAALWDAVMVLLKESVGRGYPTDPRVEPINAIREYIRRQVRA